MNYRYHSTRCRHGFCLAGIARGTAKLQEEAAANQKAKREGKSK